MPSQSDTDRRIYSLARAYLPSLHVPGVTSALIEEYLSPFPQNPRPATKRIIYQRLLESAQNANMKAGVIGRSIGGVANLSNVLSDFDPAAVRKEYGNDWRRVLRTVVAKLHPNGKIRRTPRSLWPKYCQTILSAATFVNQFSSAEAFCKWVDLLDHDPLTRAALPLMIAREVDGIGFALACDFLKEIGYVTFPKPDVHLRHIFVALGLCEYKPEDYILCKAIVRLAENAGVTPYAADKIFWLIGSGDFYANPEIGKKGKIGSRKRAFVTYARKQMHTIPPGEAGSTPVPPDLSISTATSAVEPNSKLRLGKLAVAQRQLDTAIELYFADGDPVPIHALAAAAYEVIHHVLKSRSPKNLMPDLLFNTLVIKDEHLGAWEKLVKKPQNFFKHADRDPEGTIEFSPADTEIFIFFAIIGLSHLDVLRNATERAFVQWSALNHPERLTEKGRAAYRDYLTPEGLAKIKALPKATFLQVYRANCDGAPRGPREVE